MSAIGEIVSALIERGMSPTEAATLVAQAIIEGGSRAPVPPATPSRGAARMTNYRDRREALGMPRIFDAAQFAPLLEKRDGRRCIYCSKENDLVIDHITPIFLGGNDDLNNLGFACRPCNGKKAGKTLADAKMTILIESARRAHVGDNPRTPCAQGGDSANVRPVRKSSRTPAHTDANTGAPVHPTKTPLLLTSSFDPDLENHPERKTGRKVRGRSKKELSPIPADWVIPDRARPLAAGLSVDLIALEPQFKDYLLSSGKLYADYDAAFCNFVRNAPKFNGAKNGQPKRSNSILDTLDRFQEKIGPGDMDYEPVQGSLLRVPSR